MPLPSSNEAVTLYRGLHHRAPTRTRITREEAQARRVEREIREAGRPIGETDGLSRHGISTGQNAVSAPRSTGRGGRAQSRAYFVRHGDTPDSMLQEYGVPLVRHLGGAIRAGRMIRSGWIGSPMGYVYAIDAPSDRLYCDPTMDLARQAKAEARVASEWYRAERARVRYAAAHGEAYTARRRTHEHSKRLDIG